MKEDCIQQMMYYSAELIRSQFENRKPEKIPNGMKELSILEIARTSQLQYLLGTALIQVVEDEAVKTACRQLVYQSTMRTLNQVVTLKEIANKFETDGISFQILKGAVLKAEYPRVEMREMGDIDIMIFGDGLDLAEKALKQIGFETHKFEKHHLIMMKKPNVVVELHWTLYDEQVDQAQFRYFSSEFCSETKEGSRYEKQFSIENFYVYLIAHMAKHFYENGCGIRNLLDIYIYRTKYQSQWNEKQLQNGLEQCGLVDFEKNMSRLAFVWMEKKECSSFDKNLFQYMLNCGIYGKYENGMWAKIAQDCDHRTSKKNMRDAYYFPSYQTMCEKYAWLKKAPFLLPVAWLVRGVRGMLANGSRSRKNYFDQLDDEEAKKMYEIYRTMNLRFHR